MNEKITDEEIVEIINNPWVTCGDLEDLIVRVENDEGMASPWINALSELANYLVLKAQDETD